MHLYLAKQNVVLQKCSNASKHLRTCLNACERIPAGPNRSEKLKINLAKTSPKLTKRFANASSFGHMYSKRILNSFLSIVLSVGCELAYNRALYSNRGWREKNFEDVVFEPVWRGKLFQMKVFGAAIDSVKFSPKPELSSRFSAV